jgi:hypothetical protein
MKLEHYANEEPKLDLEAYFNGPIKAWGLVQNRSGKVVNRFDLKMHGSWEGYTGTLTEDFSYYDGKKQQRVWTIQKKANNRYEGTASDIVGTAEGEIQGNAVRWAYVMDLEVGGKRYKIKFDDWMWQMNDGILINRSYLKKFGITVAELTLIMQKQTESTPSTDESNK